MVAKAAAGTCLALDRPRRVAVLRALQIGDLLCAVPALRALRAALPNSEIVLIGLPWAHRFTERFSHLLDGFREFPGYPGLPEREPRWDGIPRFLAAMRAERFDLAIQLHGSGPIVNPLIQQLGARHTAGFYRPDDACPDPLRYRPWPEEGLELRRLLSLTEFLGAPPQGEHLEFPVHDADRAELEAVEGASEFGTLDYACIHPGASVPERRWPPERFAAIADALADRGLHIVLTGTSAEVPLTRRVAGAMRHRGDDLAGRTSLGALGALLDRARLLVSNDTGVAHLADALRIPSVVLSTGDNPARWAPVDRRLHRMLCRDDGIEPSEVLAEADDLLSRERVPAA